MRHAGLTGQALYSILHGGGVAQGAVLESLKAMGATDTVKWICKVACPRGTEAYVFNPNMKVTGIYYDKHISLSLRGR